MDFVKRFTPDKFLGKYTLEKGAKINGIVMCIVTVIAMFVFLADYFHYQKAENCAESVLHGVYSFCVNAIIYCACMFGVHLWFIWGIKQRKASVVLSWVVITSIWWLQSACFVLITLLMNISNIGFSWIASLCFSIMAFLLFAYFILTGYGYWRELKTTTATTPGT